MELKNLLDFKNFDIENQIKSDNKIAKDFLNESAMSTLDIIKRESSNVEEFIEKALEEFPNLKEDEDAPRWLSDLYHGVNENVEEKGIYVIYSEDAGFDELYRGTFNSLDSAWEKANEIYVDKNQELEHYDVVGPFDSDEEANTWEASYEPALEKKKINESVTDNIIKGNEINSDFNAEEESENLFGFAQVKNATIKKVGSFTDFTKMINPKTPKERPILNAGQFIDNDVVQGYVNRIEGNKVYVESLTNPGEIIEVSIKDAVKIKKEQKEHTAEKKIEQENEKK